nr:MAG TPA: hypothetical protein [Crassvirales sp.]
MNGFSPYFIIKIRHVLLLLLVKVVGVFLIKKKL